MFHLKKISRIGLLMILSEVLIAVFAFRWLQSEFNGEKDQLQKNLFEQFMSARSRVMDSVISKKYIEPILHNPHGFKIQTVDVKGNTPPEADGKAAMEIYTQDTTHIVVNTLPDSSTKHKAKIEMRFESDTSGDLLHRGIKMLITQVSSEDSSSIFEKHVMPGDTAMLKNFFAQNLHKENLGVKVVWVCNQPMKNLPPPPFYYESEFLEQPYGVVVSGYNGFLLKEILPQILFALLLLAITSTAFIFSFRSLRNQLRLSAMKDDFISNMSHELKTPVATMKVAVEAMQQMDPAEKKEMMKDYLGMASQELSRLEQLINKVMNSILMENGKQTLQLESVNFKSLIGQTINSMQLQLQQRNARVNFTSESEEIFTQADSLHLQGVLYNLIDNSLKYGTDAPEISIHLSQTSSEVILTFKDNGPGIPEEYLDKVFDKFFRVPSGNEHTVKGFGLGLNYVAQVMKLHHGSVSVRNLPQRGCEFTLKFPTA